MNGLTLTVLRSVTKSLLKFRDTLRRCLARFAFDRPANASGPFVKRIVFIRWDAKLGDAVVLSWVWRELRRQRPDIDLVIVTASPYLNLFKKGFGIRSVDAAPKRHGWLILLKLARKLYRSEYVVHLAETLKARDMFFISRLCPRHVVGLDDTLNMIDIKLGKKTDGWHFSSKLIPWLEGLGIDASHQAYDIPSDREANAVVKSWWPQGPVIGFCPYGASEKRHLNERQILLILETLCARSDRHVLMLVQSDRVGVVRRFIEGRPWAARVLFHPTDDLFVLFEQVRLCDSIVSVDTAIVHIAAGLKKPMLAIYGDDTRNYTAWHPNLDNVCVLSPEKQSGDRVGDISLGAMQSALEDFLQQCQSDSGLRQVSQRKS